MLNKLEKNEEKEKNEMKEYEKDNLRNLKDYLKKEHNIDDIDKMKINDIIAKIKEAKRGESWKDNKLYAVKSYFNVLGRRTKMLSKTAINHTKEMKKNEKKQEQSQKELDNYLSYDELNLILEKYENYEIIEDMNKYLILACICTDQPVLRPGVLATVKIVYDKASLNDGENFIMIDKKNNKKYFYINDDKVSESEKFKNDKIINLHPTFSRIVIDSIKKFPRDYLFELNVENKEIKLLNLLQDITDMKFTFSMARSSYINHWYKIHPTANQIDIEELCREMRHSDEAHRDYYKKVKEMDGNIFKHSIMINFLTEQEKNDLINNKEEIINNNYNYDEENNSNSNSDYDYDYDSDKSVKKVLSEKYKKNAAYDLVYKVNKRLEAGEESKIKEETMKKYNILLDDDGKYYIKKKEKKITVKEKKQLKEPLSQAQFNKRKADVIRFANKRIDEGKEAFIKAETMTYYNVKYNNIKKKYE
jgi:hypothetical protein